MAWMEKKSRLKEICKLSLFTVILSTLVPQLVFSRPDWQQRVDYELDVLFDDASHSLEGTARITYQNNSPDTLAALWFRLPVEALNPESPSDRTEYRGKKNRLKDVPETDWGRLQVESWNADGRSVEFIQDGSIGRAVLTPPLTPSDSVKLTLTFRTVFPQGRAMRRTGYMNGQYKGVYWYPMICPYTPEYGWTVNRYYGTAEAYGEFGDFRIKYTLPNKYILASTGYLVNENEVLPPEKLKGLTAGAEQYIPIPEGEEAERLVTWEYFAENVPDVAFAADPTFVIDRKIYDDFESWAFVRRGREEAFIDAAEVCAWTILELEKIYGDYPWPRVYATDSWSGMEYPMLTQMSSSAPNYHYFLIHEVVHNYTPMILHSNSVDAQILDEGFTTFIEHYLTTKYRNSPLNRTINVSRGLFDRTFPIRDDDWRGRRPYLEAVLDGEDMYMVRGADIAEEYWLLRVSTYYKTPVMLNALRSILGEEQFWDGMRLYYKRHHLSLVDEWDMIHAFEDASSQSLGWFFKQFLYGDGDIDYNLDEVEIDEKADSWEVEVEVERLGVVRLPLDIAVILENGDSLFYRVPFLPTDAVLDNFQLSGFWDQLHEPNYEYESEISIDKSYAKPVAVLLDPYNLYADRSPLNQRIPRENLDFNLETGLFPQPPLPLDKYQVMFRPEAGFNALNGVMGGFHFKASFLERVNVVDGTLLLPSRENAGIPQFKLSYHTPLSDGFHPIEAGVSLGWMHADKWAEAGIHRKWRSWRPMYTESEFSLKVGIWGEDESVSNASIWADESPDKTNQFAYINASYSFSAPRQDFPWSDALTFTQGLGDDGFAVLQYEGYLKFKNIKGWHHQLENRAAVLTPDTPPLFRSTIYANAPYSIMGRPLASNWTGSKQPEFARAAGRASIISSNLATNQDWFINEQYSIGRSIDFIIPNSGNIAIDRLVNSFEIKLVQNASYYKDIDEEYLVEFGPILEMNDLYGLTVSAGWAAARYYQDEWNTIAEWNLDAWGREAAFWISYNMNQWLK
ncbi:M1 family metallopeptidase [bacterium]|nr:M1 family metallopeptidase [bacterium]